MSSVVIAGNTSGSVTLAAPDVAGTTVVNLPSGGGTFNMTAFPAGTAMLFAQTSAPTGWTKLTTHDNKALRVVSGTASSGGSVAFTTAFASQGVSGTVGDTTLSTSQIPSHNHTFSVSGNTNLVTTFNQGASNTHGAQSGNNYNGAQITFSGSGTTASSGGGASHNHSFSGTAINLAVQYVDVIIATKD